MRSDRKLAPVAAGPQQPAVSILASIKADYLVCLENGKRVKMLKRHLMTDHQIRPCEYRSKWKLPAGYPMVASNYAASRRTLALSFGLARHASPKQTSLLNSRSKRRSQLQLMTHRRRRHQEQ